MQPLGNETEYNRKPIHDADASVGGFLHAPTAGKPLPRFVRRVIRSVRGLTFLDIFQRRHFRTAAVAGFLLVGCGFLFTDDRALGGVFASMTAKAGFQVSNLVVNGNQHLDANDIKRDLSGLLGKSLLGLDAEKAREALVENRWVKTATVKKVYPDTLVIDVVEREAVALWKSSGTILVISPEGYVIDKALAQHMHLPQVVGQGANEEASQFLSTIARFPDLVARADAYVRVAERRWDLIVDDGPKVMLPSENWQDALAKLSKMQAEQEVFDREIVQIDMRLKDRLVLRLEPDAAEVRKTRIEKTLKRDWHKT